MSYNEKEQDFSNKTELSDGTNLLNENDLSEEIQSFNEIEIDLFKIIYSNKIDLVKTNLDRIKIDKICADVAPRIIDGLFGVSLYRSLKESNNPKLQSYLGLMENWINNQNPRELKNTIDRIYMELAVLPENELDNFIRILKNNTQQVYLQFIFSYESLLSDSQEARFAEEINFHTMYRNVELSITLPNLKGFSNRSKINIYVEPLNSIAEVEEQDNQITHQENSSVLAKSFSLTEIELFRNVYYIEGINLIVTDADDIGERFMEGIFSIALYRSLRESNNSILKEYSNMIDEWVKFQSYDRERLKFILEIVYYSGLSNLSRDKMNKFLLSLERNLNQVCEIFMNELDRRYGIFDVLTKHSNLNEISMKEFFKNNPVEFYRIQIPAEIIIRMWYNEIKFYVQISTIEELIRFKDNLYKIENCNKDIHSMLERIKANLDLFMQIWQISNNTNMIVVIPMRSKISR